MISPSGTDCQQLWRDPWFFYLTDDVNNLQMAPTHHKVEQWTVILNLISRRPKWVVFWQVLIVFTISANMCPHTRWPIQAWNNAWVALITQRLNCIYKDKCWIAWKWHSVCPRIGDCVLKVKVFSGRPYMGWKWGALWSLIPQLTWAFWSGSPTTVNMGVCVLQSVGLGLFAWVLLLPRLLESVFAFLYVYAVVFASLICSETVINVKEGLMKFRSKPCDALQREKNSKLKHSTKILMRWGVRNSVLKLLTNQKWNYWKIKSETPN